MNTLIKTGSVEKIVNGGFGLIRSDDGVVLINYVFPGEEIRYTIKERAKGINWGRLFEINKPDKKRIDPVCEHFGECGGCVLSHMSYEDQIKIKREILDSDLERIGRIEKRTINIIDSPEYGYRVRARLKGLDNGKIGFIRKGTNSVMAINNCILVVPEINGFIRRWNSEVSMPFFHQMDLFFNPSDGKLYVYLSEAPEDRFLKELRSFNHTVFSWKGNESPGESVLKIKEWRYRVSPEVFFQVNRFQWENMLDIVDSYLSPSDSSFDLYSGAGFFIPLLLKYSKNVTGIENSSRSVILGKGSFPEASFQRMHMEKFRIPRCGQIIVDPPRSGIPLPVKKMITAADPAVIVNISCSTATLARDLSYFQSNGYRIEEMNMIDLFPQSAHIETITWLERGTNG